MMHVCAIVYVNQPVIYIHAYDSHVLLIGVLVEQLVAVDCLWLCAAVYVALELCILYILGPCECMERPHAWLSVYYCSPFGPNRLATYVTWRIDEKWMISWNLFRLSYRIIFHIWYVSHQTSQFASIHIQKNIVVMDRRLQVLHRKTSPSLSMSLNLDSKEISPCNGFIRIGSKK